ncbi:MAG: hypothetical protein V4617_11600 [Gemmatimonadota bacterium]
MLFLTGLRSARARRVVCCLLASSMVLQAGCYTYAPLQLSEPRPAKTVGVVVNDRGRTLLGERVGALTDRIDGTIISVDSANVVMTVSRVTDLRGKSSTWTGERITIPRDAIQGFRERKISKLRTLLLLGGAALAIVATLATSLDLFGDGVAESKLPPPISES